MAQTPMIVDQSDNGSTSVTGNGLTLNLYKRNGTVTGFFTGSVTNAMANSETLLKLPSGYKAVTRYLPLNSFFGNNKCTFSINSDGETVVADGAKSAGDAPRGTFCYPLA